MKLSKRPRPFLITAALTALIALNAVGGDFPKDSPDFQDDLPAALEKSKSSGKPTIVVFSAPWCGPCQSNKKSVYPAAAVQPYHDKFVWVYLNTDLSKNRTPAKSFNVTGIPHIEFLDPTGKSMGNSVGGTSPDIFAAKLKTLLAGKAKS